ncbi:TPA: hypothetical protein KD882_003059 [Vibrio parahaemolyticus]|nr:hypothetical protein [Vibrio parahaemolyticus]HBC3882080.1 hypothetical protein [Vibrio parahaemolyticus]HBC3906626.1 hypothetical protein [Vibrio parahaemolyticus]
MPVTAICNDIGGKAPDWVQVLPGGPDIKGIDGRSWIMRNPNAIIYAFEKMKVPMVIDYEHGQEVKAPNGEEAPAAGWIEKLELRDGQIWAKVDWTKKAADAINNREYRFLSPAFSYDQNSKEIISLSSVGLTNKPNLVMQALNNRNSTDEKSWEDISKALGVKVNSSSDVLDALNNRDSDELSKKAEELVDGYISDAVFAPSQRACLIAMCKLQGIDAFNSFAIANTGFSYLKERIVHKEKTTSSKLTESQIAVCRQVGVSEEQFLNSLNKGV